MISSSNIRVATSGRFRGQGVLKIFRFILSKSERILMGSRGS